MGRHLQKRRSRRRRSDAAPGVRAAAGTPSIPARRNASENTAWRQHGAGSVAIHLERTSAGG